MATPRRRRVWFWRSLGTVSGGAFLLGIAIWATCRDQWDLVAPLFYAMPLPLIGVSGILAFECCRVLGKRKLAFVFLSAALIVIGKWSLEAFASRSDEPPRDAMRLLFWNVNRGSLGLDAIADEIVERNADVVALVESVGEGQKVEYWNRRLPGYEVSKLGGGMMLFVRGKMLELEPGRLREALGYRIMRVRVGVHEFALTIADVASDPLLSRRPAFEKIREIAGRHPKLPHVLVGDFNTPTASPLFDHLPPDYSNAFEKKGTGYRETWPMTSPVLHLDQVWGDSRVVWHRCQHGWSLRSDHRPVIVEFSLK